MAEVNPLSEREREVVGLLLQGQGNKQIALALGISESTVEFHLKNVYAKFNVSSRVELILKLGYTPGSPIVGNLGNPIVENPGKKAENREEQKSLTSWARSFRSNVSRIGQGPKMRKRWLLYVEWVLAGMGAILCIGGAISIWIPQAASNPPGVSLWPMPALLLLEIAALGLVGFIGVALEYEKYSKRWGRVILIWIACGGLVAPAILGAFTVSVISLSAFPALLFGGAAILAEFRQHRKWLFDLGILTASAVANFALIFVLISIAPI